MSKKETIEILFQKYIGNQSTAEEVRQLLAYFKSEENKDILKSQIEKYLGTEVSLKSYENLMDGVFKKLTEQIDFQTDIDCETENSPFFRRKIWYKVSVAAAVIFLFSATSYYFLKKKDNKMLSSHNIVLNHSDNDIQPGIENAVLTLDNGSIINLDKVNDGDLIQLENMVISKKNGNIIFRRLNNIKTDKPVYSTVSTLRGNEYHLILEDGTQVWLNAESSIRFPVIFSDKDRRVEVKGEAYFEVAKVASKPFRVNVLANESEIEVLGTHFNVSAYPEDNKVKTTLLEGSVKIKKSMESRILRPGDQAVYDKKNIHVSKNVNIEEVTAWKDGLFVFNNTDIKTILQQMSRWYDVEISLNGRDSFTDGFTGKISKSLPLSKFLQVLELNGVHSKIEGRTVSVW